MTSDVFPVSQSLLAAGALADLVSRDYDVGAPTDCRLWHAGITDTHLVATDRGRFVLRAYRASWRTDDEVAYELDAVRHLAGSGVAVAAPVRRRDGGWFTVVRAPEGPRQVVLFAHAPGRPALGTDGYSERYGRALAELHAAAHTFSSQHLRFRLDLGLLLDGPLSRLAPLLAGRPDDRRYLDDLAARLRRAVGARAPALDWGFCHGDAFGGNAHLEAETGALTHFDFDDCGPGWRAFDLGSYRWSLEWRTPGPRGGAATRWDEFLRGYRSRRAVAESDLAAVPLFVAIRELWVLGQNARMAPVRGQWWLINFDDRLRFLRAWEQHLPATP